MSGKRPPCLLSPYLLPRLIISKERERSICAKLPSLARLNTTLRETRNTATISAVGILLGAMANVRPFSTPLSSSTHSSYEEVFNTHLSLRVEPALSGDILLNSRQNFMSCFPFRIIDFSDVFPNYRTP